jgi:putative transposase
LPEIPLAGIQGQNIFQPYETQKTILTVGVVSFFWYTICMSKENIKHARTCVYNVNYHIVWSVKYRRSVLSAEIEDYLKELFQEIAQEKEFEVIMMEVGEKDHIHVFASAHPKIAPSYIVKMLKGISARKLFLKFPQLKKRLWDGHLWNSSFFIETIGSISEQAIKKYIENQKKGEG